MRFLLSVAIFVAGLVATAFGLVQQSQNQPINEIVAEQELKQVSNFVLIPAKVLTSYPGEVSITAAGSSQVFLASGRESDLVAWLGETKHTEIKLGLVEAEKMATLGEIERGGEGLLANPVGSDLWRSEVIQAATATIYPEPGNEIAVLVASTGVELAPPNLQVKWDLPDERGVVAPITWIGLGLMLGGGILALITYFLFWRGTRPRRTNFEPTSNPDGTRKSKKRNRIRRLFAVSAVSLVALSGCAPEYENPILSPSPLAAPDTLTPVMSQSQLDRILGDIAKVVSDSDAAFSRDGLDVRVGGPALTMRRAYYNLAQRSEEPVAPEAILAKPQQLFLPAATDAWPRSVMVVTGEAPETALQLLVLRQETPRDQYVLWSYSTLLPDTEFPEVAAPEVGAVALKTDTKFLLMPPTNLPEALGDILNKGEESAFTLFIDTKSQYIQDVAGVQQGLAETLSTATLNFEHQLGNEEIALLATLDGGALAAVYMTDTYTIIPNTRGEAVAISGPEALLLGSAGSATGIETKYGAMLLFYVPTAESDQLVRLIGATQQLLSAKSLGR